MNLQWKSSLLLQGGRPRSSGATRASYRGSRRSAGVWKRARRRTRCRGHGSVDQAGTGPELRSARLPGTRRFRPLTVILQDLLRTRGTAESRRFDALFSWARNKLRAPQIVGQDGAETVPPKDVRVLGLLSLDSVSSR